MGKGMFKVMMDVHPGSKGDEFVGHGFQVRFGNGCVVSVLFGVHCECGNRGKSYDEFREQGVFHVRSSTAEVIIFSQGVYGLWNMTKHFALRRGERFEKYLGTESLVSVPPEVVAEILWLVSQNREAENENGGA